MAVITPLVCSRECGDRSLGGIADVGLAFIAAGCLALEVLHLTAEKASDVGVKALANNCTQLVTLFVHRYQSN